MKRWYMLTVVGADRPGIVARLSDSLFRGGCNLGEASMVRLGGNFTIMLMVESVADRASLEALVAPAVKELGVRIHLDEIRAELHTHVEPNARITVHGADRAGIVAEVTGALARAGFNILDLNSDVAGTSSAPIYVMIIDGHIADGIEQLEADLAPLRASGIDLRINPIDTMLG